jgi:non-specific serine/threonine protein kinase
LWAQFHALDKGQTLGNNFYLFRQAYFNPIEHYFGVDWKFKKELEENLHNVLKNCSIKYDRTEGRKLPPLIPIIKKIQLSPEAVQYYEQVANSLEAAETTGQIKNNFTKLREICSGFLKYKSDEDGFEQEIIFDTDKLIVLEQLINDLPDDSKILIFHEFTLSGRRITEKLKEMEFEHRWLYGGEKDKVGIINEFKTNPKIRGLVLNSHSGAYGLNLQVANYFVYYESPVSGLVRAQSQGRAHREGQTQTTFMYDIVCENSVEERILQFLREGDNIYNALINGKCTIKSIIYGKENHTNL